MYIDVKYSMIAGPFYRKTLMMVINRKAVQQTFEHDTEINNTFMECNDYNGIISLHSKMVFHNDCSNSHNANTIQIYLTP